MKILKDLFTENDGESFCPLRVGFYVVLVFIILVTGYEVIFDATIHFIDHAPDWIRAVAQYITGGGAAIAGKSYVETKQ